MSAGARPVRAPRGTALTCRGWQQEAALRMLMNNLDPEVAERPDDLVVYGGTGRAARSWAAFDAIVRELRRLADDETLLVQSGKPVGRLPDPRMGPPRAHRQQQPGGQVGDLGRLPRARAEGPHDVRPDDRRVMDLHRHAGHPAGHVRDVRRAGPPALRRHAAGAGDPDGRPGRHGWCPAAGRDDERGRGHLRGGGPGAGPPPSRRGLRGPPHRVDRRGPGLGPGGRCNEGSRSPSPWSATPPRSSRSSCDAASASTW